MDIDVQQATAQPCLGKIPSHKITITDKDLSQIFWYVKKEDTCRDFDKLKQMAMVELMHAKASEMDIGKFESFTIQGGEYHLTHRSEQEFTIEALN